jgi:hypothetical protein
MSLCPKCESAMTGRTCVCGYEQAVALMVGPLPTQRQWRFCEWIVSPGHVCHVPAGVGRTDGRVGEKFCAYHQHRARLSTYGAFLSEQRAFLDWVEQFPAGTRYQPMPGIWDSDRELLWQLVSGVMEWDSFQAKLREQREQVG